MNSQDIAREREAASKQPLLNTNNPFNDSISNPPSSSSRRSNRRSDRDMDARAILASTAAYSHPSSNNSSRSKSANPRTMKQPDVTITDCDRDGPKPPSSRNGGMPTENTNRRRRASSLSRRFPGDLSHRPLDIIRKETKKANRSPHLKRNHIPGADIIDQLDASMGQLYHHEGPYDATLKARNNTKPQYSPLEAVKYTNAEAIKATPNEMIQDSLRKHVPLQGTAVIPPGRRQLSGEIMMYKEGDDLMRDPDAAGGPYKRWDGVKYLPEDLKGKGEPSFSIERQLKQNDRRRGASDTNDSYEMQPGRHLRPDRPPHQRSISDYSKGYGKGVAKSTATEVDDFGNSNSSPAGDSMSYATYQSEVKRSNSVGTGSKLAGLKRRIGSLRRSRRTESGDQAQL